MLKIKSFHFLKPFKSLWWSLDSTLESTVFPNIGTVPAGSGSTGTYSCLWGLCCSSLPAPDHFHMGWNEREKGNERQRGGRKRQMRAWNGLRLVAGGRVSGLLEPNYNLSLKRRCEQKIEDMVAGRGKERMQMCPGCSPELLHPEDAFFRPKPATLLPQVTPQSQCTTLFSPLLFLFIVGTPLWTPRPNVEKLTLTFMFLLFCLHVFFQAAS